MVLAFTHLAESQSGSLPFAAGMTCTKLGERQALEGAGLGRPLSRRQPARSRVGHQPGQIKLTRSLKELDTHVLVTIEVHLIGEARQTGSELAKGYQQGASQISSTRSSSQERCVSKARQSSEHAVLKRPRNSFYNGHMMHISTIQTRLLQKDKCPASF